MDRDYHKKIKLINDPRLTQELSHVRSGGNHTFYTGNDHRDFERYRKEGGNTKRDVMLHEKRDNIYITPPKESWYASLEDGEWWWIEGCAQCCGMDRTHYSYRECDEHNVCDTCAKPRGDFKEAVWGTLTGWRCKPCETKQHNEAKAEALAAMSDDFDEWDYRGLDHPKCPYCNLEYTNFFHDGHLDDSIIECERCDNSFKISPEVSVDYTCSKVEENVQDNS